MGVDCNYQKITQSYINNKYEKNECWDKNAKILYWWDLIIVAKNHQRTYMGTEMN